MRCKRKEASLEQLPKSMAVKGEKEREEKELQTIGRFLLFHSIQSPEYVKGLT